MVSFDLSEEQISLRNLARDFSKKEIQPKSKFHDETGDWPVDILKKAWDLGLINSQIPSKFNGLGLSDFNSTIISEELGWGCTGISTAITANSLGQAPLILAGSDEQKKKWLVPFSHEHLICSYAVTEPDSGSDVSSLKTVAEKKMDKFILNGQKMWITGAGHADWFFVLAKTNPKLGHKGMSAFIVPSNLNGIIIGKKENNMGQRASDTRGIIFENVELDKNNLLGCEGDGFLIAMKAFDHTRPLVASSAIGLARCAMEHSISYAKERKAFGVPISNHQGISFLISDMASDIEAGRFLVWKAALEADKGKRNTLFAAYAKRFSADIAMRTAIDAVQIFGGNGFNKEYPVEKLMRDAKIFQIYEGTSQIQRVIIARELFKN